MYIATFFNAFEINLLPSFFLPLIVINKSFFFTNRESIESPLNFLILIFFLISSIIFLIFTKFGSL